MPTLCDLAGINYEGSKVIDGKSLEPLLLSENPEWPNRLIFNYWRGRTSVRSQQYRLDHENRLFDMMEDPGQYQDVSAENPEIHDQLVLAKTAWEKKVLSELPRVDERTFPLGHPDFKYSSGPFLGHV